MSEIDAETLGKMRRFAEATPDTRWAAYRNVALDSADIGGVRFLAVGPNCTLKAPPARYPDTPQYGVGWRYLFEGWLNLETGEIDKVTTPPAANQR